jgi:hypothetical protein
LEPVSLSLLKSALPFFIEAASSFACGADTRFPYFLASTDASAVFIYINTIQLQSQTQNQIKHQHQQVLLGSVLEPLTLHSELTPLAQRKSPCYY